MSILNPVMYQMYIVIFYTDYFVMLFFLIRCIIFIMCVDIVYPNHVWVYELNINVAFHGNKLLKK